MQKQIDSTLESALERIGPLYVEQPIRLDWLSRQSRLGDRLSDAKGTGRDYCDFRRYQPGDSVRRINWKMVSKRPDRPMVTLFEEERTATICVIADVSETMNMASVSLSKRELAALVAGSIVRSTARTWDQSQLTTYDSAGLVRHFKKRSAQQMVHTAAATVLDTNTDSSRCSDSSDGEPSSGDGLAQALGLIKPRRSLVFVISDFLSMSAADLEALKYTSARHEVICLLVCDHRERLLPDVRLLPFLRLPGLYTVTDVTGNQETILTTKAARRRHQMRFDTRLAETFRALDERGCKYASLCTSDGHEKRQQMLVRIFTGRRCSLNLN